jgi:hypothetical protein
MFICEQLNYVRYHHSSVYILFSVRYGHSSVDILFSVRDAFLE